MNEQLLDAMHGSIYLVDQALRKLERPQANANGGEVQLGGVYWRLSKALEFIEPFLYEVEGKKHADFLINTHRKTGINISAKSPIKPKEKVAQVKKQKIAATLLDTSTTRFITKKQAALRLGVSWSTLDRWAKDKPDFPQPIPFSSTGARIRYIESEITDYMNKIIENGRENING